MKLGSKHYLIEYCLFEYLIDSYIYVNNKTQVQDLFSRILIKGNYLDKTYLNKCTFIILSIYN